MIFDNIMVSNGRVACTLCDTILGLATFDHAMQVIFEAHRETCNSERKKEECRS
jgi:hypothetical protein